MPRHKMQGPVTPSKFWSMKENKEGASVGNFVKNIKSTPAAFKEAGEAVKKGKLGAMIYRDMNPMGKKMVDFLKRRK